MGVLDNTALVDDRAPKSTDAIIVEPSIVAMQQRHRIDPKLLSSNLDALTARAIELIDSLIT